MSHRSSSAVTYETETVEDVEPVRLTGAELDAFLGRFLYQIDYEIMGAFFLTYRRYLSSFELFMKISGAWSDSYDDSDEIMSRYTRIRIFVALRHWLLNYFPDDFLPFSELQGTVVQFLLRLGGVGADEISTEARIAKELRKTWDRQCELYGSIVVSIDQIQPRSATFLTNRHITLAVAITSRDSNDDATQQKSIETRGDVDDERDSDSILQTIDRRRSSSPVQLLESQHIITNDTTPDRHLSVLEAKTNTSETVRSESADTLVSEPEDSTPVDPGNPTSPTIGEFQGTSVPDTMSQPVRALRRKPGGILKNVKTVAEVVANNRLSITSKEYSFPKKKFDRLNAAFSMRTTHRPRLSIEKVFTQDLARVFQDDHCDESQEDVAVVLAKTMDKLEGRNEHTYINPMIPDCRRFDPTKTASLTLGCQYDHSQLQTISPGSRKRKRHAGCLDTSCNSSRASHRKGQVLQKSELSMPCKLDVNEWSQESQQLRKADCKAPSVDRPSHTKQQSNLFPSRDTHLDSDGEVSIIEALGIAPAPVLAREPTSIGSSSYCSWITQKNPAIISKSLLKIEQAIFHELDWLELTCGSRTDRLIDHVQDWHEVMAMGWRSVALILARNVLTSAWVVSEILHTTIDIDRVRVLTAFIDVAELCRNHNNFSSLVQIVRALQKPSIKRLTGTWIDLSRETRRTWSRLTALCDPHGHQAVLRSVQERVLLNPDASVMPFLTPYLDNIEQVHASRTLTITDKMLSVAKTTKVLMEMMDRIKITSEAGKEDGEEEELNYSLLDRLVWIRGIDDDQAMKLSVFCEA